MKNLYKLLIVLAFLSWLIALNRIIDYFDAREAINNIIESAGKYMNEDQLNEMIAEYKIAGSFYRFIVETAFYIIAGIVFYGLSKMKLCMDDTVKLVESLDENQKQLVNIIKYNLEKNKEDK